MAQQQIAASTFDINLQVKTVALALLAVLGMIGPAAQAQTLSVLHSFTYGSDGAVPVDGLTMDALGNLYGTASEGGDYGVGTVFKLAYRNSGWVFASLYSFKGGIDGAQPVAPVVIGPNNSLYGTTYLGGLQQCDGARYACGTVFNLRPPAHATGSVMGGWGKTPVYVFPGGTDGAQPFSGLSFDSSGNMYGTTYSGGTAGVGTVYQITPFGSGWVESVIYSFDNGGDSNACLPYAGVVIDAAGNLYGTASACGMNGYGSVYMLTPSAGGWTETPLYEFTGGADGKIPHGGLLLDAAGNLYGTTTSGGAGLGGTVFELTQSGGSWIFQTIYSINGCFLCGPTRALTMDQAGNLYGTTFQDGAYGYGNVFELTPSDGGWNYTSIHDFDGPFSPGGGNPYTTVTIDSSGNLYGTTSEWGHDGYGVVWEITP
jgi:uncharacterized repeat protein (TIGR03803 family)